MYAKKSKWTFVKQAHTRNMWCVRGFQNIACVRNITHSFVFLATCSLLIRISVFETPLNAYTRNLTSEKHTHTFKIWSVRVVLNNESVRKNTHVCEFLAPTCLFIRKGVVETALYAYITKGTHKLNTPTHKMWCVRVFRNRAFVGKNTHLSVFLVTTHVIVLVGVFETTVYAWITERT